MNTPAPGTQAASNFWDREMQLSEACWYALFHLKGEKQYTRDQAILRLQRALRRMLDELEAELHDEQPGE